VLPAELRQLDRIEAGQEFDVERFEDTMSGTPLKRSR
jgi:hypothetical protein